MQDVATIDDTTLIIIAIISALPAVLVALINRHAHKETRSRLDENTEKTESVLHQVQNDHKTNLREDLDRFKGDVYSTLEKIESAQGYLGTSLGTLLRDVKQNIRNQRAHDIASALVVDELRKRDHDLQIEIRKHHPSEETHNEDNV